MENLIERTVNRVKPVVHSDRAMVRTIILLGVVLLMAVLVMEYIRRVWKDDFELRTPGANGAVIFHSSFDHGFRKVVFLVPASQCWINTQLLFEPGETIKFTTSGQIHLAQKLITQEELPIIEWSKPDGSPFIETVPGSTRSDFLISQHRASNNAHPLIGDLVGFLHVDGVDDEPGPNNPRPVGKQNNTVFHIGHEHSITNETGHRAYLWLSINDIVLDETPKAEQAYLGEVHDYIKEHVNKDSLEALEKGQKFARAAAQKQAVINWKKHNESWKLIKAAKRWDLYFSDNIGTYLVFIEKESKRGF